ncbi:hypothetical protein JTE90_009815 [Oedothorax gibbosus]|uniref:Uncharacterized protein n=1 Tax=Oedothorax gibbosus TaxID=931172 RepID=A0AAV6TLZ8_9ARAC|nr:hypothetical protein JTE90_009815 [Oedothorax gibbosus]
MVTVIGFLRLCGRIFERRQQPGLGLESPARQEPHIALSLAPSCFQSGTDLGEPPHKPVQAGARGRGVHETNLCVGIAHQKSVYRVLPPGN